MRMKEIFSVQGMSQFPRSIKGLDSFYREGIGFYIKMGINLDAEPYQQDFL
jgi:hypothetical protein